MCVCDSSKRALVRVWLKSVHSCTSKKLAAERYISVHLFLIYMLFKKKTLKLQN